jgi:hypothetical protein
VELTEEKIAELKQRHGKTLISVECPGGETVVVRKPTKEEWADFTDSIVRDKTSKHACMERYALQCIVFPERGDAVKLLAEYPAFTASLAGEINKIAGAQDELSVKKL